MTIEDIRTRVAEFDKNPGWYQNIDLKNGVATKTRRVWGEKIDHPRERWEAVRPAFPATFKGKSVLDLGCNAGFFSFIAAERGAARVCGVDYNEKFVEQARFANEVRGDNVEFHVGGVTPLNFKRNTFDVTLCIGLLYHVTDIMGAIMEIGRVTKEYAIVESAILETHEDHPLVLVADQNTSKPGTWHPNIPALRKMFQLAHFTRTEILFKKDGRGGIVAWK